MANDRHRTRAAGASRALPRNPYIDLLRGLAILLVVVNHLQIRVPLEDSAWLSWAPARFLSGIGTHGYEAVFLFFVISGFLITANAINRWGGLSRINMREFYTLRFARIVPCLLALVATLSALDLL
ncbi:MAG: acyltransferase family protein, partial [Steroidobacteraceae bacterium]